MNSILILAQSTVAEDAVPTGWEAISKGQGISIAITGMLIVFLALTLISLFLKVLPAILEWMGPILPRLEAHGPPPGPEEQMSKDHERIVAAIGYVLHMEIEKAAGSSK